MSMLKSIDHICKRPKLYLGNVEPNGILLATRLAESALRVGASLVELRVIDAGWISVSGESDWITANAQKLREGIALQRVFTCLMPQSRGIPNEVRFEPVVTAFSRCLAVKSDTQWTLIVGDLPSKKVQHTLPHPQSALFVP